MLDQRELEPVRLAIRILEEDAVFLRGERNRAASEMAAHVSAAAARLRMLHRQALNAVPPRGKHDGPPPRPAAEDAPEPGCFVAVGIAPTGDPEPTDEEKMHSMEQAARRRDAPPPPPPWQQVPCEISQTDIPGGRPPGC